MCAASITVFINGVATEVPRGPIDLRSMFGQDVMLVHSTGGILPVNEYGILMQSLQMGESYFLVSTLLSSRLLPQIIIIKKKYSVADVQAAQTKCMHFIKFIYNAHA